jgi:hypothetical protein
MARLASQFPAFVIDVDGKLADEEEKKKKEKRRKEKESRKKKEKKKDSWPDRVNFSEII